MDDSGAGPSSFAEFSWPQPPEVAGVHHLLPEAGPLPRWGWHKTAAGAPQCRWSCGKCGRGAMNSSRMLELLRTPCGDQAVGRWTAAQHKAQARGDRVECTICVTTRQRHIALEKQRCPVRVWAEAGGEADVEIPDGTSVHAAWSRTLQAMHRAAKNPAGGAGRQEAVGAPADDTELAEPVCEPCTLQPFRSHRIVVSGSMAWCMACYSKQPRFRRNVWKTSSCKGQQPVAHCPKHVLATLGQHPTVWPEGKAERGRALGAAAELLRRSAASKALRPPKRRVAFPVTLPAPPVAG